jgi:ornithine--oxo-acid transaminase
MFKYDRFVVLTSGGEAVDAALKMARKWGYLTKKIPAGQAHILSTTSCYHGVGLSTLMLASRKSCRELILIFLHMSVAHQSLVFQPLLPKTGHISPSGHPVRFGNLEDVKKVFKLDGPNIAAIIVEAIQGAAGYDLPCSMDT